MKTAPADVLWPGEIRASLPRVTPAEVELTKWMLTLHPENAMESTVLAFLAEARFPGVVLSLICDRLATRLRRGVTRLHGDSAVTAPDAVSAGECCRRGECPWKGIPMRTARLSHVSRYLLAPAAALALGLSLAACSVSVGGSDNGGADSAGSGDASTEAAAQGQDGSSGSDSSSGSADSGEDAGSGTSGTSDTDASDITDPGWQDAISNGTRQTVSGSYAISGSGESLNLVGDLDGELGVLGSDVTVAAENVGTLAVAGSDVTVYVRSVSTVMITGSDVTVYWLNGTPDVTDMGSGNVATQIG